MKIIQFQQPSVDTNNFNFKSKTTKRSIKNNKNLQFKSNKKKRSIINRPRDDKKYFLTLKKIILSIIVILLIGICGVIISLVVHKIKNKKVSRKPFEDMSGSSLKTSKNPDLNSLVELDFNLLIQNISYKESETLLGLEIIKENNILLNKAMDNINNTLIIIENSNNQLNKINSEIFYNPPNLLKNPIKASLKIIKSDLELYKRKYEELKEKINNYTDTIIHSFKNIYSPINNTRNEVNTISFQFKKRIKDLFTILVLQQNGLKNIYTRKLEEINKNKFDEDNSFLYNRQEEFKNEISELNKLYNILFSYINQTNQIINNEIIEISNEVKDLKNKIEEGIMEYEQDLQKFTDQEDAQKFHENLIKIKKSFLSLKDNINKKKK